MTTTHPLLQAIIPLVADIARELPSAERYRRLLQALRVLLPCDAVALLRLEDGWLLPLAVDGLSADTLGRRFRVGEHPRFAALLESEGPLRFPADSPLPDPYDGLVEGHRGHLPVHDCVGCAIRLDDKPWGLLTLDDLASDRFSSLDLAMLQSFGSLAAATVSVAARIEQLHSRVERESLRAEGYRLAAAPHARKLSGRSTAMRKLQKEIELVAHSELPVLIQGETGVGKELVAEALHAGSPRSARPMISLNCAALPETLVESELFGHVKGAFTGALSERPGKFELADGGTLFLDEVGELALPVQAKLLRVLQSGQLQRLGSDREHRVDVRLIAASNRNLADEVRAGRLRADFYHRLSVYPLQVPPLRERGRDVLLLAGFFLEENRSRLGLGGLRLDAGAQAALLAYDWPGNVRELEHLIGRSVLKALGRQPQRPRILSLMAEDLDLPGRRAEPSVQEGEGATPLPSEGLSLRDAVARLERQLVSDALARHGFNRSAAARALGMDRANLARLAKRLGLESDTQASPELR
ncbi:nitric oxide reductase transcriptional regulator NorR [Variovorax sp. WS11]|uniref:nitric oxide reductase transcriptional regulator NorR n=1 Tax=Variovorax sp. WS11 TaxID=1105204 RepID=UPI000D0E1F3D|nr:nitric oxide reductase transcriptional regulator NorR [Variovorax sp. WS11]NDZ18520.1 nitric oxide reductase transcriptional regulator NorR [Variovorax sp. WS11]PSL85154.1 nitric oxide reductase transcriptional regulator NorR [Variovorax sp. WS11]